MRGKPRRTYVDGVHSSQAQRCKSRRLRQEEQCRPHPTTPVLTQLPLLLLSDPRVSLLTTDELLSSSHPRLATRALFLTHLKISDSESQGSQIAAPLAAWGCLQNRFRAKGV